MAYIAQTDLTVGFATDSSGRPQLVTTRIPHNAANFNPFIEPSDDLARVPGTGHEIDGTSHTPPIAADVSGNHLALTIPDPQHVQMRNSPAEFTCGPQQSSQVAVEYAATPGSKIDGIVRGLEFILVHPR